MRRNAADTEADTGSRGATDRSTLELRRPTALPRTSDQRLLNLEESTAQGFAQVGVRLTDIQRDVQRSALQTAQIGHWEADLYPVVRFLCLRLKRHPSLAEIAAEFNAAFPHFTDMYGRSADAFVSRQAAKLRHYVRNLFTDWTRRTKSSITRKVGLQNYRTVDMKAHGEEILKAYAPRSKIQKLAKTIFYPGDAAAEPNDSDAAHIAYVVACWTQGRPVNIAGGGLSRLDSGSDTEEDDPDEPLMDFKAIGETYFFF
eukprot:TRINITY_DN1243_c0_g1_i4.p1 TRINITY_DN1243_c0_g1~~TRINITY_DN1243_c0_g1_i4.p1  ORF type:complete len:295 (+),score=44.18 TRINITY_DN1243_c0_g1_i4:114-887(+)